MSNVDELRHKTYIKVRIRTDARADAVAPVEIGFETYNGAIKSSNSLSTSQASGVAQQFNLQRLDWVT